MSLNVSPVMAGEDFGMYGRVEPVIPTSLFWLGSVDQAAYDQSLREGVMLPSLHSSKFLPSPKRNH